MRQAALLFLSGAFLTVVISGLYGFIFPFTKTSVTVHVFFGLLITISVFLHLYERRKSLLKFLDLRHKAKLKLAALAILLILITGCLLELPPASWLLNLSYENRHRNEIFRPKRDIVFQEIDGRYKVLKETNEIKSYLEVILTDQQEKVYVGVWAEDDFGNMIEPLFVSEDLKFNEKSRSIYLPVWSYRYKKMQNKFIESTEADSDSIASATIRHSFNLNGIIGKQKNGFHLKIELNVLNDENQFYHSQSENILLKSPPGIGQPSVIYSCFVDLHEKHVDSWFLLKFEGKSDVEGESGDIIPNDDGLTTARNVINRALLNIEFK